jgi:hypothetical protein
MGRMLGALGVAGCWLLLASPAHADVVVPISLPQIPPVVVAPGSLTVGPVQLDPKVTVGPSGATVHVATTPPVLDTGTNVSLTPPPSPTVAPKRAAALPTPVAATATAIAPRAPARAAGAQPPVIAPKTHAAVVAAHATLVTPQQISGAVDAPHSSPWTAQFLSAARSYGALVLLLLAALALRMFMGQSFRAARSA